MAITRTYAVGENGTVRRLDNHTGPWIDISPALSTQPWRVLDVMADPNDPDKVTIVGDNSGTGTGILVSYDAGVNWFQPNIIGNPAKGFSEVWYVDSDTIWIVGTGASAYVSTDGGLNFTGAFIPGANIWGLAIHAISPSVAVIAASSSTLDTDNNLEVWKTINGGITWFLLNGGLPITSVVANPIGVADGIWISDDQSKIIVSTNYKQLVSTDSGATFTEQPLEMVRSGRHLTWYPSYGTPDYFKHTGGPIHHIFTSIDGGTSWTDDRPTELIYIRGAHFYSTNNGYYVAGGATYHTTDGGVTGTVSDPGTSTLVDVMYAVWTAKSNPVYRLTDCTGEQDPIYSDSTLLSPHVGTGVIQITGTTPSVDGPLPDACWQVEEWKDPTVPLSFISSVDTVFQDCDSCLPEPVENICYDFVSCNGQCDDILGVNSVTFADSLIPGSLYYVNNDPSCIYEVYPVRQATFINLQTITLSDPLGDFQNGLDDHTLSVTSLIYNGVQQVSTPYNYLLTPVNYQVVECSGLTATPVPVNTTENCVDNTQIFLNQVFAALGLPLEAFSDDPVNCGIQNQAFRVQYRGSDTFAITFQISNNSGVTSYLFEVQAGDVTVYTDLISQTETESCNTNTLCSVESHPVITSVFAWEGECPPVPEPEGLGESCDLTPSPARIGEPGFTWKNCDPKEVVAVKTTFADSVYALFKRMRYGIETCCEFDLDKADIKNQLVDLGKLYDPDLCDPDQPLPHGCCPPPCNVIATLIIPLSVACPAPVDVLTSLELGEPVNLCLPPEGSADDGSVITTLEL